MAAPARRRTAIETAAEPRNSSRAFLAGFAAFGVGFCGTTPIRFSIASRGSVSGAVSDIGAAMADAAEGSKTSRFRAISAQTAF